MNFEHCIRCTICVESCPVFKVNPAYPGPKQAGPDSQRFRLDNEKSVDSWIKLCCQCKKCNVACPYGVNPADIILEAQLAYSEEHLMPLTAHMFANNYYMETLGSAFAPIANRVTGISIVKNIMNVVGISTYMPMPSFHALSLGRSWKKKGKGKKKVVFFYGCFLNYNRPDLGRKIRDLLVSMGLEVILPHQVCCGLPALGNGDLKTARRFAKKNAGILCDYIDRGYDVVYACTSCGLTLVHDYPGILDLPNGQKVAENTWNIHEYILDLIDDGYVEPVFGQMNKQIAYHIPCHLRALGIGYPATRLFDMIPGLEYKIFDENCCGLSGSYGFKKKNQETSIKLGEIAAKAITDTRPDVLVSDCGACRMQLGHFTRLDALDPAEILIESLTKATQKS